MCFELDLTKTNRIKLAHAFRSVKRVDYAITCVIEGQMGQAFVDDLTDPTIYQLVIGPFNYYAGTAVSLRAQAMIANFPAYNLLMPSAAGWPDLARQQFGDTLQTNERHSFSSDQLSAEHLHQLLAGNPFQEQVVSIDAELAARLSENSEVYFDLTDFDSAEDFSARGLGYAALVDDEPVGTAYSSLVCSQGIEVSIFVAESHRRQGVATALGCNLLLACLQRQIRPNWDAANPESVKLAEKLGYCSTGSYEAYYHTQN